MDAKELPGLLHAIDNYVGAEHTRLALQLMALTFVRTSELIGTRWCEFDIDAACWDIPHQHIELQLAHQERDDTSAAYNHAQYLEPRARMMQAWADYLDHYVGKSPRRSRRERPTIDK